MNNILPPDIKCIVVDPSNKQSMDIFHNFYYGVYREAFPHEDECESYENFMGYIQKYGGKELYVHILIFYNEEDIVGGMVIDHFGKINTLAIEFIVVAKKYQRQGLATKMIKYTNSYVEQQHGRKIDWTIIEVENPKLVGQEANANIYFWGQCHFRAIGFNYIQPALSPTQKPVEILLLCAYHHHNNATTISIAHVKTFLQLYSHYAMGIDDPLKNPTILQMFEELDSNDSGNLDLIDIKEFLA